LPPDAAISLATAMVAAAPGSDPNGFLLLAPLLPVENAPAGAISPLSPLVLSPARGIWISSPTAASDPRSMEEATFNRDRRPMMPLNRALSKASSFSSASPNVTKYASASIGSQSRNFPRKGAVRQFGAALLSPFLDHLLPHRTIEASTRGSHALKSRFTSTPHAPDRPCGSLRPGHLAKYFPLTRTTRDLRWRSKISEATGKSIAILFACALSCPPAN
jgi:hypothetical protein